MRRQVTLANQEAAGAYLAGLFEDTTLSATHGRDLASDRTSWMAHERSSDFRNTSSLAQLVFPKSIGKWPLSSEVRTGTFKKCR